MRSFAEACPDNDFVQQVAAQIPWFHNYVILDKVRDVQELKRQIGTVGKISDFSKFMNIFGNWSGGPINFSRSKWISSKCSSD